MPITGFLYTALSGYPVPLLMVWDLSKLVAVNKPAGEWFKLAHLTLQWLLYFVVLLHVAGALHHHLVRKDWGAAAHAVVAGGVGEPVSERSAAGQTLRRMVAGLLRLFGELRIEVSGAANSECVTRCAEGGMRAMAVTRNPL